MTYLSFKDVSKTYKKNIALSEISFEINDGSKAALIGPNGVGKTTLMNLIATLSRPSSGEILIDGKTPRQMLKKKRNLGYYHQNFRFPEKAVVREYLDFLFTLGGFTRNEKNEFLSKWSQAVQLERIGGQKMSSLSHGETEKLNFLQAIAGSPPVLLLDEPFLALDINAKNWMLKFLKKLYPENRVTLISSHNLNELMDDLCDYFLFLKEGKIFKAMDRQKLHDAFDVIEVSEAEVAAAIEKAAKLMGEETKAIPAAKGRYHVVLENKDKPDTIWKKETATLGKTKKPTLETIYQYLYAETTDFDIPV